MHPLCTTTARVSPVLVHVQATRAALTCCQDMQLPGKLQLASSFSLAALHLIAPDFEALADLDPAYPPNTVLVEMGDGIYAQPGMLRAWDPGRSGPGRERRVARGCMHLLVCERVWGDVARSARACVHMCLCVCVSVSACACVLLAGCTRMCVSALECACACGVPMCGSVRLGCGDVVCMLLFILWRLFWEHMS